MGGPLFLLPLLFLSSCAALGIGWVLILLNDYWWRPKKLERWLKQRGIVGPPYKFLTGNLKENFEMLKEARSKPMELSHRIVPRVFPFIHQTVKHYECRLCFLCYNSILISPACSCLSKTLFFPLRQYLAVFNNFTWNCYDVLSSVFWGRSVLLLEWLGSEGRNAAAS
ncbi:hypothetical protein H6P81_003508 [Aristolochia fimbriata]|uniref:Cytochrome P450 n=1 Tax=Aristolochia fimbriata TaxID=158543 RepID=A0AAV7FCS8_ARIFI|nr:hypothetical protein H6P81_003508 [Aristolochia fimbriata]